MTETACRPSPAAILRFAEMAHNLELERHVGQQRLQPALIRPNQDTLVRFLGAASPKIEDRKNRFRYNPWKMAGLDRYEVRNSAVLGRLFDRTISPIAGPLFLARYLELVSDANDGANLPVIDADCSYHVAIEHCPLGSQSERVDLTIEGPGFFVGIEVKIDASEGLDQLDRYVEVIHGRAVLRNCALYPVIYLSPRPSGRLGSVLESSWEHVGRAADQVSCELEDRNPRAAWLLRCFAEHVRDFY